MSTDLGDFWLTHWLDLLFRSFFFDVEIGHRIGSKKFHCQAVVFDGIFCCTFIDIFFGFMDGQVSKTLMLPAMRAPKYIAAFVCLLLAITLFQFFMWPGQPAPGWQPSWWQSRTWADIGMPLFMPAGIPALILAFLGTKSVVLAWVAIASGFIIEIGLTYLFVYFLTRYLFRRYYEIRTHRPVA